MKKLLFSFLLVAGFAMNAQTVIWSDDFNDEDISDWTLYDEDGDGFLWDAAQLVDGDTGEPIGTPIITSVSWSGAPLTPDNWIVTPAIDLTSATGEITLKWYVFASDPLWNLENYGVYVATSNSVTALTTAGELFTEDELPAALEERTLDLSDFAGETIYIGFRHYDVTDQFRIGIDDVSVEAGEGGGGEFCTPDPLDCTDGDVIFNVTFAGINNDSDCSPNGYGDYTTTVDPAEVQAGETYEISMNIGAGWYEKVSMWIDFDNNMTFDADERFDVVEGDMGGTLTNEITIPADAADGTYRMRIYLSAAGSTGEYPQDPCVDEAVEIYGEIEDYMVTVGGGGPVETNCDDQEVPSNNLENGLFFGGDGDQLLAVDVAVGDTGYPVYGVDLNVFTDGNTDLSFTVTFYEDDAGLPGAVHAITTASVNSSELVGNAFGFDVYNFVTAFATPVDLDANTTYWMQVESDGLAWEATTATLLGSGLAFNNANTGGVWTNDPATELVYNLICEELGVSNMNSFDFAYYPNPVKDILYIDAKKAISSVSVNNLTGQQVMNKVNISNGQIDVTSLNSGVYVFRVTLEGGQVETFKIIKK